MYSSSDLDSVEKYLVSQPNSTPYLHPSWVQSIEQSYNHQFLYLLAKLQDRICGVMPIVIMRSPFGGSKLCSLPFCDVGGCLADSAEIREKLILKAQALMKEENIGNLEVREAGELLELDKNEAKQRAGEKVRMILPLPESSEELWSSFKSKLRSQIRKSEKNGLNFEIGSSAALVDEFYQVFAVNMRALGSPVHGKELFINLQKLMKDRMVISIVRCDGKAIGAGIVLIGGQNASIPWASTLSEFNRLAPNMMVYWSLLEHITDQGCKNFDFGRSSIGEGTYRFKEQWGAKPHQLIWRNFSQTKELPLEPATSGSKIRDIVAKVWSKLPIKLTTILGPYLRKHISL